MKKKTLPVSYRLLSYLLLVSLPGIWQACSPVTDEELPFFRVLSADETGIRFINKLTPSSDLNIFNYMYFYNGGGVGAGDFNNDGLIDLVFTANQGPNKLYLNRGGMKFEDISRNAGFVSEEDHWSTGVSVVDINQDGLLDIYISQVGDYLGMQGRNLLFVCKKIEDSIPVYEEQAAKYGLDLVGFGTQAVFFDYDMDGDLDFFQLNHSVHNNGTFGKRDNYANTFHPRAGDRLFRNDRGSYVEMTKEAGINSTALGYGLGVVAADLNLDGYPDLYGCNDFHENDYLYINQRNGHFRDEMESRIRHTSRFSMGVDAADINNDGYAELVTLDMLPYEPKILKRSEGEDAYYNFDFKIKQGYNYQFARNNLQLNNQNGTFSEIGMFAGIHATDWSWSPLLLDIDNDGLKDIVISNGINKRMNDTDYINFVSNDKIQGKISRGEFNESDVSLVDLLPEVKLPNHFFLNTSTLQFRNITPRIEGNLPSYSNGMIYADLDNDGDLDVVTNNINDTPFLYENLSNSLFPENKSLSVQLAGPADNRNALGAKLLVFGHQKRIAYEKWAVRGYQSSAEIPLTIGLGSNPVVDSIAVIWPDNSYQILAYDSTAKRQLRVSYQPGLPRFDYSVLHGNLSAPELEDVTEATGLHIRHVENMFNEFDREALIPHKTSTEGPALAVADINHDGLDDLYLGSSKWERSRVMMQMPGGRFVEKIQPDLVRDSTYEEVDAKWVDVNADGHPDLVVASGGNEFYGKSPFLQPRLYLNDGQGSLFLYESAFPDDIYLIASCVEVVDYNQDGHPDLFFGGRAVPWSYGKKADSYLFQNNGKGKFADVTGQVAPELRNLGMVKSAVWTRLGEAYELVVALEWDGIVAFGSRGNKWDKRYLTTRRGWWNMLYPIDIDQDGDLDILVGNLGLNSRLKATEKQPVRMYVNDLDQNGRAEQLITYYVQDQETLFPDKREVERQLPYIKKKYIYSKEFAQASIKDLFGDEKLATSTIWEADFFENSLLVNNGKGEFSLQALPAPLQYAPYYAAAMLGETVSEGLLLAGNFFDCNIQMGRYDADFGMFVRPVAQARSFEVQSLGWTGQFRKIRPIKINGSSCLVLARNNDFLKVVRLDRDRKKIIASRF